MNQVLYDNAASKGYQDKLASKEFGINAAAVTNPSSPPQPDPPVSQAAAQIPHSTVEKQSQTATHQSTHATTQNSSQATPTAHPPAPRAYQNSSTETHLPPTHPSPVSSSVKAQEEPDQKIHC